MKPTLWTRDFTLVTVATALGAIGGIAGGFALSFMVFDETGSTIASALIVAIQLIPYFVLPLFFAPRMDRLPRKPFLVGGDLAAGVIYALMGLYLLHFDFSYLGYLAVSLLLACIGSLDELAYNSMYPMLIPKGMEQKGYAVSGMLYPVLKVLMMPISAVLLETIGASMLLLSQGGLSIIAAVVESRIRVQEEKRMEEKRYTFQLWRQDVREAAEYLRKERGLQNIFAYMAVTNGMGSGYAPLLVAFFRTTPGFTVAMYSFYSVTEFIGRTIGGTVQYRVQIPKKKKFSFAFLTYQFYECMDMCLLWLPYPLMLVNRGLCGFLGSNSATMRQAAVQSYIPEELRARVNAFETMAYTAANCLLCMLVGAMGEVLDYRLCLTVCGMVSCAVCWLTIWCGRKDVRKLYETERVRDV